MPLLRLLITSFMMSNACSLLGFRHLAWKQRLDCSVFDATFLSLRFSKMFFVADFPARTVHPDTFRILGVLGLKLHSCKVRFNDLR